MDDLDEKFNQLPEEVQEFLSRHHDHRILPNGSDEIIYREKDILELLTTIINNDIERLQAENRYMKECLETITKLNDDSVEILLSWSEYFKGKEANSQVACLEFIKKYSKDIPQDIKCKISVFETVDCECGHKCPVEFARIDEDGNWTCANCVIKLAEEKKQ